MRLSGDAERHQRDRQRARHARLARAYVVGRRAAIGLMLVMLGAIQKKIFVWKNGFWGSDGLGWNYDLIMVSILVVVLFTDGGRFVLLR